MRAISKTKIGKKEMIALLHCNHRKNSGETFRPLSQANLNSQSQLRPQDADQAAPESEDGGHEEDPHNKRPTFGVVADDIPQENDAHGA